MVDITKVAADNVKKKLHGETTGSSSTSSSTNCAGTVDAYSNRKPPPPASSPARSIVAGIAGEMEKWAPFSVGKHCSACTRPATDEDPSWQDFRLGGQPTRKLLFGGRGNSIADEQA